MKVIDVKAKGNLVRFYLGQNDCEDYYGDDWNDYPYEDNCGVVYDKFITAHIDICFPLDYEVITNLNPGKYCRNDFKTGKLICLQAINEKENTIFTFRFNDPEEKVYKVSNTVYRMSRHSNL